MVTIIAVTEEHLFSTPDRHGRDTDEILHYFELVFNSDHNIQHQRYHYDGTHSHTELDAPVQLPPPPHKIRNPF